MFIEISSFNAMQTMISDEINQDFRYKMGEVAAMSWVLDFVTECERELRSIKEI